MIVCLLKNDYISSIELPNKIQGQFWLHDSEGRRVIAIEGIGNDWILKSNANAIFADNDDRVILKREVIYRLMDQKSNLFHIYVEREFDDSYFLKYRINFDNGEITLGRQEGNSIQVDDLAISKKHLSIICDNGRLYLRDNHSTNGTFVNYKKVDECDLKIGDVIYTLGVKIIVGLGFLSINKNRSIVINEKDLSLMEFSYYKLDEEVEVEPIDYFYRSPRVKRDIQVNKIEVDSPPDNQIGEEMPFMLVVGPSLTMGLASLSTGIFAISNAVSNGNVASAMPSIVMSFSMLLGTVLWPIVSKRYEKKRKVEKEQNRQLKFGRYLDQKEKEITKYANEQVSIWNENFPTIEECKRKIYEKDSSLFERNSFHNDFLDVRVGLGKRRVALDVQYAKKSFSLVEDNLRERLYRICRSEKVIDNVPITVSLLKQYILGIVGNEDAFKKLLYNILIQLVSFYGYDDVKLVVIYDEKKQEYDCFKWLPHVFDNHKENRFIARNATEIKELSMYFESIINERKNLNEQDIKNQLPYYIIINLDRQLGAKADFIRTISKLKRNIHFSIIHLCHSLKELPSDCMTVLEVGGRSGNFYDLNDMTGNKVYFVPDQSNHDMESLCKRLANISLDITENDALLPNMLTFLQMYNVGKVEHLNALTRWKENDPTLSLEVPIGVDKQGDLFYLDLHEKYHGPHGLVAGMTGSGKSEFIMTYILSLAINYHPDEVAFILIDYKGGGMAKAFETLPHTAGIITNLDGGSVKRSLISIQSELKRRQSIFADVSKRLNVSNLDIYKYQRLYRQQKVKEPLQHLFIISDEFAELKTQQPDFMEQLVSAARIGRSLGVHLILATQKPSGVVDDQIWSNSRFRICLKVQERADSMDMLKRPDAANLSQTGRFYLQVGYNELFELGQSAWAGAPYYPYDKTMIEKDDSVDLIDINGHIIQSIKLDYRKQQYPNANKQLDDITTYLQRIALEEHISIRQLWLDPIPEKIYCDELESKYSLKEKESFIIEPLIGEYDDPYHQRQAPLYLPISKGGNTIIYGISGSGKTTFLTTLIYSLTKQYTPKEVNIYLLDFASETLNCFKEANHVGDVMLSFEEEKITNFFKMLVDELKIRKKLFANYGGDITTYNLENTNKKASIVVMIHNFTAFDEIYETMEEYVSYLTREGSKYGIYFIVTTSSTTGIRFKLQQNFAQTISLQMNEDSDYTAILGKTNGLVPMNYLARGLIKVNGDLYEFQTAHISRNINSYKEIVTYCKELKNQYTVVARHVPILPEVVDYDYLRQYMDQGNSKLPIGIDCINLQPYFYDYQSDYINYIVVENMGYQKNIKAFVSLFDQNELFVIDEFNVQTTVNTLFEIVLKRNNEYKETKDITTLVAGYQSLVVIIKDLDHLLDEINDEIAEKLELILEKGRVAYKLHIILIESSKNISKQSHTTWFEKNVNKNNVLWLGDGFSNQYVFNDKINNHSFHNMNKDCIVALKSGIPNMVKMITQEEIEDE